MKSKLRAPGPPSSSSWPVFALRPSFHHVLATSKWSKVQDWGSILLQVRSPLLGHVPCIPPHPYRALDVHSELIPRRSPGATPLREPCPWTRPHRERPWGGGLHSVRSGHLSSLQQCTDPAQGQRQGEFPLSWCCLHISQKQRRISEPGSCRQSRRQQRDLTFFIYFIVPRVSSFICSTSKC